MSFVSLIGDNALEGVCFQWKIHNFSLLSDKVDNFYASPSFSLEDTQWHLLLFPNGQTKYSSSGWVSFYLSRKDPGPPKTVYYALSIKNCDGVVEKIFHDKDMFPGKHFICGYPKCLLRTELKNRNLLSDDTLNVICDVSYSNPLSAFKNEEKVLKSLLSMLKCGEDSDVVIKIQGKEFPSHRGILRARSPVFRSMFSRDIEKQSVVTIDYGDLETFGDFLFHIYTGSCQHISTENVYGLYTAADKYDFCELKVECSRFIEKCITVAAFCDIITLAVQHDDKELIESSTNFFCKNSIDIVKTAEWQTFLKENSRLGNELVLKAMSQSCANLCQIKYSSPKCSKRLNVRKFFSKVLQMF